MTRLEEMQSMCVFIDGLPFIRRSACTHIAHQHHNNSPIMWALSFYCIFKSAWLGKHQKQSCGDTLARVKINENLEPNIHSTQLYLWNFPSIIIIIIIIAFKGAIRDLLQSPHSAANCLQHVRSSGPSAIVYKSRATHRALISCKCHATCHLARRDSSAIKPDRVEIAFIWALFYWLNH